MMWKITTDLITADRKANSLNEQLSSISGTLMKKKGVNYISPMITETVKAEIKGTEQRLARLLFKVAVELGKLSHAFAAVNEVDDETMRALHAMCVDEVRKINGIITYENAEKYQHG